MKCPFCTAIETKVIDSRLNQLGDITRRRRECTHCEGRFTTYERVEEVMPAVIKKDGRREPFDRNKLFTGIKIACQKRPVTTAQIEKVVRYVEKKIQSYGLKELPARTVGQMVMTQIHQLDKVAFVRFASVYRDFRDVDEFVAELKESQIQEAAQLQLEDSSLSFPFVSEERPS